MINKLMTTHLSVRCSVVLDSSHNIVLNKNFICANFKNVADINKNIENNVDLPIESRQFLSIYRGVKDKQAFTSTIRK